MLRVNARIEFWKKSNFHHFFYPKRLSEKIGLTPQHSQPNNRNMKDRSFSLILHKENSLKIQ
eukprot:UN21834